MKLVLKAVKVDSHRPTDMSSINPGWATYRVEVSGDIPAGWTPAATPTYGGSNFFHDLASRAGLLATHRRAVDGRLEPLTPGDSRVVADRRPWEEFVLIDENGKVWAQTGSDHYDPRRASECIFEAELAPMSELPHRR